jgi:nucleoside phosphorylase
MKGSGKNSKKSSDDRESSIIHPRELVQAITKRGAEELSLKKRAIVVFDATSLDLLKKNTGARPNIYWFPYRKIFEIPQKNTFFVRSYPSSPNIAILAEEMWEFGSREMILFGLCGSIAEDVSIGDVVIVEGAICGEGTSFNYGVKRGSLIMSNWFEEWRKPAEDEGFITSYVWTTDGLYRETKRKIDHYRKKGATLVDMEVASFYAVCNYLNLKGIAFLLTSDRLTDPVWVPGFHSDEFTFGREKILRFLLNKSIL